MSLRLSTGLRNALVGRVGLPHAVLTGVTGAFVDSTLDSITDSGNGLVTKGFEVGDWIKVFGSNGGDNDVIEAKLLSVIAGEMEFAAGEVVTAGAFLAGTSVIAAKGGSIQDILKHGVIHVYSGTQPLTADLTESGTKRLEITEDGTTHVPSTGLYGLEFEDDAVGGAISKLAAQSWEGDGISPGGGIGWFRFYDQAVTLGGGTTGIWFDGSVALSGAQLNVASITVTTGVAFVINNFSITVPAS